jgi:conjugal transfer/type IV secretion protein DotA/TraY
VSTNFRKIILILFTLMLSYNINAIDNTNNCEGSIDKAVTQILGLSEDDTKEKAEDRDKYLETLMVYFFSTKESTFTERYEQFKKTAGPCLSSTLENDVAVRVVRLLFGEEVNKPLIFINSQLNKEFQTVTEINEEKLNEAAGVMNVIPELIQNFNVLIFSIATIFVGMLYGKTTLSFLSEKNPNKLKHSSKNLSRILLGLSLIAPISFFSNYSLIQIIFLFFILIGILLAKFIWLIVSISISFSSILVNTENFIYEENIIPSLTEPILDNISLHVCDLTKIEKYMQLSQYQHRNNIDTIKNMEYYKCLTSSSIDQNFNMNKGSEVSYIPTKILRSQICSMKHQEFQMEEEYCGYIRKDQKTIETFDVQNDDFQNVLREIAYELIMMKCKMYGDGKATKADRKFECVKMNPLTFEYKFDSETRKVLTENSTLENDKERSAAMDEFQKNLSTKVQLFLSNNKEVLINKIKPELKKIISNNLTQYFELYEKGFAVAGTIFYEKFGGLQEKSNLATRIKNNYSVKTINGTTLFSYLKDSENSHDTLSRILFGLEKESEMATTLGSSLLYFSTNNFVAGNLVGNIGEHRVKQNRSLLRSWTDLSGNSASCISDYNTCKVISINPFLQLMEEGRQMVSDSIYLKLGFTVTNKIYAFASQTNGSKLLDFLSSVLTIYLFAGIFFSIFLPFIPFITYASLFVAWIVQTLKVLIACQLLSVYFLVPEDNEDFAGKEVKLYKILLKTAIQPLFLIVGFLVALLLANISITLINLWLSIAQETLGLNNPSSTPLFFVYNVIGSIIYAAFVTLAILKSNEAIGAIPKSLSKWLDIELEEDNSFSMVKNIMESYVIPRIKTSMVL